MDDDRRCRNKATLGLFDTALGMCSQSWRTLQQVNVRLSAGPLITADLPTAPSQAPPPRPPHGRSTTPLVYTSWGLVVGATHWMTGLMLTEAVAAACCVRLRLSYLIAPALKLRQQKGSTQELTADLVKIIKVLGFNKTQLAQKL